MTLKAVKFALAAGLALAGAVTLPIGALAFDDAEKKEMGEIIRQYLIDNPEVLAEAQQALEAKRDLAKQQAAAEAVDANKDAIFNDKTDIALGNPKGDVTIVEFFDYNCGYCRHAISDMQSIIEKDKNVRFVLKELPILGPDSLAAHKVSDAFRKIAPEKYRDFHLALLGGEGHANEEKAIAVAGSLGVEEAALRKMMADSPNDASVRDAYQLAASLGISGTPSYIVGNEAVFGAVGADALEEKVANLRSCGKTAC